MTILVTGGCGYIGSHTIVDLLNNNMEVISVDNFSKESVKASTEPSTSPLRIIFSSLN